MTIEFRTFDLPNSTTTASRRPLNKRILISSFPGSPRDDDHRRVRDMRGRMAEGVLGAAGHVLAGLRGTDRGGGRAGLHPQPAAAPGRRVVRRRPGVLRLQYRRLRQPGGFI